MPEKHLFSDGRAMDPVDAGVAAGIKAGQNVLQQARKKAAEEARKVAEKAVEETLRITELPTGNSKKPRTRYVEEVNIPEVVKGRNLTTHAAVMHGVYATGT